MLVLLAVDALVAVVDVADATEVDDNAAFDEAAACGFSTFGLEVLDEMGPISIADSSVRETLLLARLSTDFRFARDSEKAVGVETERQWLVVSAF